MHWRGSLNDRPRAAAKFYAVLAVAMFIGFALDYFNVNAVRMLFLAAVVNGLLAPPLLALVVMLTSDEKIMGARVNQPLLRLLGWATVVIMTLASAAMIVSWLL